MIEHRTAASRRAWVSPAVGRTLVLVGLGMGLWVAGSATSSAAAADLPQPLAPVTAPLQDVADRTGRLLSPVSTAVTPVVAPVVEAVAPVVDAVAPVVDVVAPVGERVLAPVVRVVEPVIRAVEPVTTPVVAVLSPVLEPVVAPITPVLEPVLRPVPVVVPDVVGAPAVEPVAAAVVDSAPLLVMPSPTGDELASPAVVRSLVAAPDARTGAVERPAGDAPAAVAPGSGGHHLPLPAPVVPAGAPAPAPATLSAPSSPDQPASDLPPAAIPVVLAALYAAGDDARNAAADRALDPTFAPD